MLFGFLYTLDLLSRSHSNRTVIPSKLNAVQYRNGVKYMFMHVQTALMFYTTSSMRRHQITQNQTTTASLLHQVIGGSRGVRTDTVLSVNQVSDRPRYRNIPV